MKKTKILYTLCAAIAFTALFALSAYAALQGDVNRDGIVQSDDARLCLRQVVGLESYAYGSAQYDACDVTHNGIVTAEDARWILRAAVGLEEPDYRFDIPMTVYSSEGGSITLTGMESVYEQGVGSALKLTFRITDFSGETAYVGYDAVTVNGYNTGIDDYGYRLPAWGTLNINVMINEDSAVFNENQWGMLTMDSCSIRFIFTYDNDDRYYQAPVTFYPTEHSAFREIYLPEGVTYKSTFSNSDLIWGFGHASYSYTAYPVNGNYYLEDFYADYYFQNNADHPVDLVISDVVINDTYAVPYEAWFYVFPGTAAVPYISIDPDFFDDVGITSLKRIDYTITVYDGIRSTPAYTGNYHLSWQ